jgi:hypothetical protein
VESLVAGVDEMFRSGHGAGGAKKLKVSHSAPWKKFSNGEPFHSKSGGERNRQFDSIRHVVKTRLGRTL